jgi:O-antigen ligase
MNIIVENRWFALADLALVTLAGIGWALAPQLGWWLLPLAILPWVLRLAAGRFPFKRTYFDLLLLIFAMTAFMGVWAAYDRESALAKFWLLVAGILLFYSLAGQPRDNLWLIAGLISATGVGVAAFFLLTHDWQGTPAKIGLIQQAAVWWMGIKPNLVSGDIHRNTAGGMMALSAPFVVALGEFAWREKRLLLSIWVVVAGLLLAVGLLLTTSWGAWIALSAAFGLWLLWSLSRKLAESMDRSAALIFSTAIILVTILAVVVVAITPGGVLALTERLLGPTNGATRLDLAESAIYLMGDFPFTGGGLASFPGLYSHYILGIPFYYYGYSHNIFFDIALEQGVLGLVAFTLIYLLCFWLLLRNLQNSSQPTLILALIASLVVILVHGLVDNILYYQWGAMLVFMIPGLVIGIAQPTPEQNQEDTQFQQQSRYRWRSLGIGGTVMVAVILVILGITYRQTWQASWYANLGAIEMARIDLADFPSGQWKDEYTDALLQPVKQNFLIALGHNPNNRTANHRLGLIAMQRSDFSSAVSYLKSARQMDSDHRGIIKSLGYAYAWSGEFDQATPLIAQILEARQELSNYIWWWQRQGREDLAQNANNMLLALDSQTY